MKLLGSRHSQRGIALIPVVFTLAIIAAVTYLSTRQNITAISVTQNEIDKTNEDAAAKAVLEQAKWQLMYNDCVKPSDTTATPYGQHTYDTSYSGTLPEVSVTTTLHTDSGLALTRSTEPLTVYDYKQPRSEIIQPDAGDSEDAYLEGESGHEDHNKGGSDELVVNPESNRQDRTLLAFDLSSLPTNIDLSTASLDLYQYSNSGSPITVEVHRLSDQWDEGEVTWEERENGEDWNNEGGDFDSAIAGSFVADGENHWRTANITELTRYWLDNPALNYGVIAMAPAQSGKHEKKFRASSYGTESERPKLSITYMCECGQTCSSGTVVEDIKLSTEADTELAGVKTTTDDVLIYRSLSGQASILVDGETLFGGNRIAAMHQLSNNNFVLSFHNNGNVGGLAFTSGDLIEYDVTNDIAYMRFDASEYGLSGRTNSVYVDPLGQILLSRNDSGVLNGISFNNKDLLSFNRSTGATSIVIDESAIKYGEKITGVHSNSAGNMILSFDVEADWDGETYTKGSIVEFDPSDETHTLYFDGNRFNPETSISALHIGSPSGELPPVLVAHWDFNEGSGNVARDNINGLDANLLTAPAQATWVSGGNNGALDFDGVDDALKVDDNNLLDFSRALTISANVYLDQTDTSGYHIILSKHTNGSKSFQMHINDGEVQFRLGGSHYSSSAVLSPQTWHHLAAVYDGYGGQYKLFLDGALLVSGTTSEVLTNNSNPVWIGANDKGNYFPGALDDIRLYREALSDEWIKKLADDRPTGTPLTAASASADAPLLSASRSADSMDSIASWQCNGEYRDNFLDADPAASYGSIDWSAFPAIKNESSSWSNSSADVRINNGYMTLKDDSHTYTRQVNLSGASTAFFSYAYDRDSIEDADEFVSVYVSSVASPSSSDWTKVATHGAGDDPTWQSQAIDISAHISANTRIRFETSEQFQAYDYLKINFLNVSCSP